MTDFSQRLSALEERYQQGVAEFKKTSRAFDKTLTAARDKYPPMSAKQKEELAEHYRSGRAGATLRGLQLKVDRGEITWDEIERGQRDPELTAAYYKSFEEGGRLLRAAVDGESIDDYLPSDGPAERQASEAPTPSDDDYFEEGKFFGDR